MKNYYLPSHIYACSYNNQVVILNTKADEYLILDSDISKTLIQLINENNTNITAEDIATLTTENLIIDSKYPLPTRIIESKTSSGMHEVAWRVKEKKRIKCSTILILRAYLYLLATNLKIKILGLNYAIKELKSKSSIFIPRKYTKYEIDEIIKALNTACYFFPSVNKCLNWSLTLCNLLLNKGIKCNFVIGIQNFPFIAHAWVKLKGGAILADDNSLHEKLAVILSEPFGGLK